MSENKIDTGGPAFPGTWGQFNEVGGQVASEDGMTLRDHFAGKALPAEIEGWLRSETRPDYKEIAESCYEAADAMLQARKK